MVETAKHIRATHPFPDIPGAVRLHDASLETFIDDLAFIEDFGEMDTSAAAHFLTETNDKLDQHLFKAGLVQNRRKQDVTPSMRKNTLATDASTNTLGWATFSPPW